MTSAPISDASSIDVLERADGSVVIREHPLLSLRQSFALVLAGCALTALALLVPSDSWLVDFAMQMPFYMALGAIAVGGGAIAVDFGWTELRATSEGVELTRRVLFFRLREKLPFPVDISAPAKGIEVTHRFGRYRFAARLSSIDSTRLVNYLLAKFPVLERMDAA